MKTLCIPGHLNTIKVYLTKPESPVMKTLCVQILSIAFFLTIYSCTKSPVTVQKDQFGYGDRLFGIIVGLPKDLHVQARIGRERVALGHGAGDQRVGGDAGRVCGQDQ